MAPDCYPTDRETKSGDDFICTIAGKAITARNTLSSLRKALAGVSECFLSFNDAKFAPVENARASAHSIGIARLWWDTVAYAATEFGWHPERPEWREWITCNVIARATERFPGRETDDMIRDHIADRLSATHKAIR